ncbi:MAG: peptidyl-prolyl cis-trans isomerase [Xanthomonadales bacterium]|nr:peptidyl-prolyl cis-trans isomerase [Xanthomonadales bacterium]NIX12086.1 peptidyl-prolyl cis-trans isomerase [Xanthomonadales bacterium]
MYQKLALFLLLGFPVSLVAKGDCFPGEVLPDNPFPIVELTTSMGTIAVELNRNRAPATSNNFLRYVLEGHYDNTIFHRVIPDFVVQGGGYTPEIEERDVHDPVLNESGNGLENNLGTIAMARFNDPHSATSQFYFNLKNNEALNPNSRNWGYTVFGDVIEGMEVLEAIGAVETGFSEALGAPDVPVETVILVTAKVR